MAPDLVGTIPQWLTGGGVFALVGLWWKRDVALRKISSGEAGDLRDHYAEELTAVRGERVQDRADALKVESHLREMITLSDRRHAECEAARADDREERARMHAESIQDRTRMQEEIDGLKRQIPEVSADKLLILEGRGKPSEVAPHSVAAAKRIKENGGDK